MVMAAWRSQPVDIKPIAAIRNAMWEVFGSMSPEQVDEMMDRGRLLFSIPELRQVAIGELTRSVQMIADELAARLGRPSDDLEVRVFGGAIMGAMLAAMLPMVESNSGDMMSAVDQALGFIEKGMPL